MFLGYIQQRTEIRGPFVKKEEMGLWKRPPRSCSVHFNGQDMCLVYQRIKDYDSVTAFHFSYMIAST